MILDASGDVDFPSHEPYNKTESDDPEKVQNNNPPNGKKKCLIIIIVISVIIVLAVGIFLAIYFGLKKEEDGGSITVYFEYQQSKNDKIFSEKYNINDKDFKIIGNYGRLLDIPINSNRRLENNEYNFKKGITQIKIKFNKVLTSMESMFENRQELIYADFSELNSKKIININKLFFNCQNLGEVIFNDYDAKKLETMEHTFENCTKLRMLDLSSFSTPKLNSMDSAFKGCTNLFSLNLKNFIFDSKININDITTECDSLINIDLPSNNKDFIKPNNIPENLNQCEEVDTYPCRKCELKDFGNNISISYCKNCPHRFYKSKYSLYPIKCERCLENCHQCENGYECKECEEGYNLIKESLINDECRINNLPTYYIDNTDYSHSTDGGTDGNLL